MSVDIAQANPHTVIGRYAGFVTRALALVIDLALLSIVIGVISIASHLITTLFVQGEVATTIIGAIVIATTVLLPNIYWIVMWMLTGQTVGMGMMGVRVVRTNGGRVTIGVAIRRVIGYYISTILLLGFLWVLIDSRRQGWADKLAGTFVVYTRPSEEFQHTQPRRVTSAKPPRALLPAPDRPE